MSGIAGVYHFDGREALSADIERMTTALAGRGPDGAGAWNRGAVGLGHRSLWTTPESVTERLPMADREESVVVTADARIDNRDELFRVLGFGGRPSREVSDGELILAAYARWGERCPEHLLGDFAFAVWDRRRQTLFCARDHFGVKPFYYHRSPRVFAFASEIKALLCLPGVPRRLNEVRVADYLLPILEDMEITFYEGILRLPPAHTLTVSPEGAEPRRFWSLDPSRELRLGSDEAYAEAFRELFTEAVRCRLRSAFSVGAMLSGGLDSSSIVCVARRLLAEAGGARLHTISAIFEDAPECDERRFINAVVAQNGVRPHYLRGDAITPLTGIDRVLWDHDEPFWNLYMYMHRGLLETAHHAGVRILLDGFGGDGVVSYGTLRLAELARAGRLKTLATEVMGLSRRLERPPWTIVRQQVVGALTPEPVRSAWRWLLRRNEPLWARNRTLKVDFARRIGLAERVEALLDGRSRSPRTARESHWRELTSGVNAFGFEVFGAAGAAFPLDLRYPFFDRRLAEFCLALPPEQKLASGYPRMIARRALAGVLPEEVRWRSGKADFSPNFMRGLLGLDRELVEDVVLRDPSTIEAYVDVAALRDAYRRCAGRGVQPEALAVWGAVTLALWLRRTKLGTMNRRGDLR